MIYKRDVFSDRDLNVSQINARREKMNQNNLVVFKSVKSNLDQLKGNLSDNTANNHERDKEGNDDLFDESDQNIFMSQLDQTDEV
jgi:hypothetical protein